MTLIQQYNEVKNVNILNAKHLDDIKYKLKGDFSEMKKENQNKIEQLKSNLHN